MYKETDNTHFLEQLVSREFYEYYRKNRIRVSKGLNKYQSFERYVRGMFEDIKKCIIKNRAGVYLRGIGYFGFEIRETHYSKKDNFFSKLKPFKKTYITFRAGLEPSINSDFILVQTKIKIKKSLRRDDYIYNPALIEVKKNIDKAIRAMNRLTVENRTLDDNDTYTDYS
jgi:hypothetical protein